MRKLLVAGIAVLGVIMVVGALGRMFAPWGHAARMGGWQEGPRAGAQYAPGPREEWRGEGRGFGPGEGRGFGPGEGRGFVGREESRGGPGFAMHGHGHGHRGWGKPFFLPFFWWSGFITKLALIALVVAIFLRGRQLRRDDAPPPPSAGTPGPETV
jgi:hypothetical protein